MIKRLLCLFLAISMIFTSGIVEAVAVSLDSQEEQSEQVTVPIGDVSDMFVTEETQPAEETQPVVETLPVEQPAVKAAVKGESQGFAYEVLENGNCCITGYTGDATDLEIPGVLDGYTVEAIGNSAFSQNETLTSVVLPEGILSIGSHAFQKCKQLAKVILPDTVESIGSEAFTRCTALTEVNYPVSLTKISGYGDGIFTGCTALTAMVVPEGVTALAGKVFADSSITDVTLPSTLESIGDYAFQNGSLAAVVLPDSLLTIGNYAFQNCKALENIQFGSKLLEIGHNAFSNCTKLTKLDLPATVETIGNEAFAKCTALTEVTYPVGLTEISGYGDGIFTGCTALATMVVPEGVTALPDKVFQNSGLVSVTLPSTLETIGDYAFQNSSLAEVVLPDSLTYIGDHAFGNCKNLENVVFGQNIQEIGYRGFSGCVKLTRLELPASLQTTDEEVFYNCTALTEVTYPVGLTKISGYGSGIFLGCTSLTSMVVPEGVTALPNKIFQNSSLVSVTLPSTLETIGEYAFQNSSLVEVVLPDSLTLIGHHAFENCDSLENVTFGENVTEIGYRAFAKCTKLTRVELPASLQTTDEEVFADCTALAEVNYPVGLTKISGYGSGIFLGCTSLTSMVVPEGVTALPNKIFQNASLVSVTLPSTLETIGDYAFQNSSLAEVVLPDSVTYIGHNAFEGCKNLENVVFGQNIQEIGYRAFAKCTKLTQVELPASLQTTDEEVFYGCTALTEVNYPIGLTKISGYGDGIFAGCTALTTMVVPEGVTALPNKIFQNSALVSVTLPSALETIGDYAFRNSSLVEVVLPDSVTYIGDNAFESCKNLENVVFGQNIQEIGYRGFSGCDKLIRLELPASLQTTDAEVFYGCTALTEVNYPVGLTKIAGYGDGIFTGCTALTSMVVPEGVTALPNKIFYNSSISSVTLPSTLVTIGSNAFYGCPITEISLPDSVTTIDAYAFCNCKALSSIDFGEGLTSIGYGAFEKCTALTGIQLPQTVTSMGRYAFQNCTALESVVLSDRLNVLDNETFMGCSSLRTVHLPRYLITLGYRAFGNCVSLTELYIPSFTTRISEYAFDGIPNLTILCSLDSYAAEFALDYRYPIIPTRIDGEEPVTPLVTENSYYIHNYDGLSAAGVMSMTVRYELKEDAGVTPTAITVHVYDFAALQENTLTLDGVLCTNYEYDEETGRLTVPVSAASGTLRFCMKPLEYEALTSYARLLYTDGSGNSAKALIGSVNSLMPTLNISAREETAAADVMVTGLATPEAEVSLFVDGVFAKKVKANKVGDYSASVSLGDPVDGKDYIITAEVIDRDGNPVVAQTTVRYRKNTPELRDFVMIYSGRRTSLVAIQGTRPVMTFRPSTTFRFEVDFKNPDSVTDVYVVSTRNNVKKYMKATWDQELGVFVAEGFFDPLDKSYVPGVLSLEYVSGREKISFDREVDFSSQEAQDALPQVWKDADIQVKNDTEGDLKLGVSIGEEEENVSFDLSINTQNIPEYLTPENAESYGFTKVTDDFGKDLYIRSARGGGGGGAYFGPVAPQFSVIDFAADEYTDYIIDEIKDYAGDAFTEMGAGPVWDALSIAFTIQDGIGTYKDINELQDIAMRNPNLTAQEKMLFEQKAAEAQFLNGFSTVVQCALAGASIYAAIAFPPALPIIAVGSAVVGGVLDLAMKLKMWELTASAYGLNVKFKWAIDPSGYVYDEVTGLRLSGVTVHAYWIENVDENPDFFDVKPGEDEYGALWASMEYSQMNPLLTDEEGRYAWDVPEGWWRVSYEKEGYETTWSEWLPVPPPQTEVNIGLMPIGGAPYAAGDIDANRTVDQEDAVYLLLNTMYGAEFYPLSGASGDVDRNQTVNQEDVVYLLLYTMFGERFYPLNVQ